MTELERLIRLRNYLNCEDGKLLISYLSDILTANCCKNRESQEIKGFGECIEAIKLIPSKVEKTKE